ncbi:MAG: hypothetical protein PVI35_03415 [Acidimicrobiia bacterium]|jgi:hypothetical protein
MGHTSGFRRGGRDLTHHFEGSRIHRSKASRAYEARLERHRKLHEERPAADTRDAGEPEE